MTNIIGSGPWPGCHDDRVDVCWNSDYFGTVQFPDVRSLTLGLDLKREFGFKLLIDRIPHGGRNTKIEMWITSHKKWIPAFAQVSGYNPEGQR